MQIILKTMARQGSPVHDAMSFRSCSVLAVHQFWYVGGSYPSWGLPGEALAVAYEKNYAWVFGQEQLLNKRCKHTRTVKILRKNSWRAKTAWHHIYGHRFFIIFPIVRACHSILILVIFYFFLFLLINWDRGLSILLILPQKQLFCSIDFLYFFPYFIDSCCDLYYFPFSTYFWLNTVIFFPSFLMEAKILDLESSFLI